MAYNNSKSGGTRVTNVARSMIEVVFPSEGLVATLIQAGEKKEVICFSVPTMGHDLVVAAELEPGRVIFYNLGVISAVAMEGFLAFEVVTTGTYIEGEQRNIKVYIPRDLVRTSMVNNLF